MQDALSEIHAHLQMRHYRNKQHVQLGIIIRLLHELGWDVWSPGEVCLHYAVGTGDVKKIADLALMTGTRPAVIFALVEASIFKRELILAERQLADTSRRSESSLCILTDGQGWRFYLTQGQGTLAERCFETLDLLSDPLPKVAESLHAFLGRPSLHAGAATKRAEYALQRKQMYSVLLGSLPTARQMAEAPGHQSLVQTLTELVGSTGHRYRQEEVAAFLKSLEDTPGPVAPEPIRAQETVEERAEPISPAKTQAASQGVHELNPHGPLDLRYTTIESALIAGEKVAKWNALLDTAIRIACERGLSLRELERVTTVKFGQGKQHDDRYHLVAGTELSVESLDLSGCAQNTFLIAQQLNVELIIKFRWRSREGAAHPGEEGIIRWSPKV